MEEKKIDVNSLLYELGEARVLTNSAIKQIDMIIRQISLLVQPVEPTLEGKDETKDVPNVSKAVPTK